MRGPPNDPCPCGSGQKYKRCCGPLHDGLPAATPEALMRSRYAAYVVGDAAYVVATTHPGSPHQEADRARWLESIRTFCRQSRFTGLRVLGGRVEGDTGWVSFEAHLTQGGRAGVIAENSRFHRVDGRWLYDADDPA